MESRNSKLHRSDDLLRVLIQNNGSDLHLQTGEVPIGRIHGQLMLQTTGDWVRILCAHRLAYDENARHREEETARARGTPGNSFASNPALLRKLHEPY